MKIPAKLQSALYEISKKVQPKIPLADIFESMNFYGITAVQEDGTPWSGLLLGETGHVTFNLHKDGKEISNLLVLGWSKYNTGRYEVNCYIS